MTGTPTVRRRQRLTIFVVAVLSYCCFLGATASFGFAPTPAPSSQKAPQRPLLLLLGSSPTRALALQKDRRLSIFSWRAAKRSSFVNNVLKSSSSSRDEEIAKLEQQLRELKQQQDDPTTVDAAAAATAAVSDDDVAYSDMRKKKNAVVNDRGVREILPGKDMILTEQDLVDSQLLDNSDSDNKGLLGVVPGIAIALAAAVALFFFAQVPVGQEDYMRYSAAPTTTKTIDLGDLNMDVKR